MTVQTTMIHVRVDDQLKAQATEALANVGMSVSDAVRLLLKKVVDEGGLPIGLVGTSEAQDAWFRAKVHEALADYRPTLSHRDAMEKMKTSIQKKRHSDS